MQRVIAYVDGFNLYNGLKDKHGYRYLWLDLEQLVQRLLRPGQGLDEVVYFTARVRNRLGSERRQSIYLDALAATCPKVSIVEGRFQLKRLRCRACGATRPSYEEKETDVSIAAALVEHAALNRYDTALLISADSDLCPAVRAVKRLRPAARVVAAFPPRRRSDDLRAVVDASFTTGDANLRRSQLPERVRSRIGVDLHRPAKWR
ncbi:MAG TPA: NYN domain-containing protein [Kribbellaceae bacterium]